MVGVESSLSLCEVEVFSAGAGKSNMLDTSVMNSWTRSHFVLLTLSTKRTRGNLDPFLILLTSFLNPINYEKPVRDEHIVDSYHFSHRHSVLMAIVSLKDIPRESCTDSAAIDKVVAFNRTCYDLHLTEGNTFAKARGSCLKQRGDLWNNVGRSALELITRELDRKKHTFKVRKQKHNFY